jgi:hypothetical protein
VTDADRLAAIEAYWLSEDSDCHGDAVCEQATDDVRYLVSCVRALEAELAAWKPERVECPFCGAHYYHRASEPCPQCKQFLPED